MMNAKHTTTLGMTTSILVCTLALGLGAAACGEPEPSSLNDRRLFRDREGEENGTASGDPRSLQSAPIDSNSGQPMPTAAVPAEQSASALKCSGLEKKACTTCCQIAFPGMEGALRNTFGVCICQDPGECSAVCGTNFCSGKAPTDACEACVAQSKVCMPATLTVCEASPVCNAYMACVTSCDQ